MKAFLVGISLMTFTVISSVTDLPLQASAFSKTSDVERRAQLKRANARALVKGRGTLRIAAFGSSNMWGAGLLNRYDALPYLLSDEVDNYAMFASGPNYPSVCAQTIVGDDDVYDAIFLDYWLNAHQGLLQLAKRLRARYPNAMIFFVQIWLPLHARRKEVGGGDVSFEEWRKATFLPDADVNMVVRAIEADDAEWYFPNHPEADIIINDARLSVDGYDIRIPRKDTAKETLAFYLHFFNKQHAQLSPMGHDYLANMTKTKIKNKLQEQRTTATSLVDFKESGNWGRGDSCHLWYTTGGYNAAYSPELKMHEFDPHKGKFGLEVTAPGWIMVKNPFEDERTLYVSFLSTIEGHYPEATISIGESGEKILLVPINAEDTRGAQNARTIAIGKVPPGESKVFIQPQGTTANFFRLVGMSFTNEEAVPLEFGFGPQFNR